MVQGGRKVGKAPRAQFPRCLATVSAQISWDVQHTAHRPEFPDLQVTMSIPKTAGRRYSRQSLDDMLRRAM